LVKRLSGLAFLLLLTGLLLRSLPLSSQALWTPFEDGEVVEDFITYFQRTRTGMIAGCNRMWRQPMFDIST
jgi:hypothetical protein